MSPILQPRQRKKLTRMSNMPPHLKFTPASNTTPNPHCAKNTQPISSPIHIYHHPSHTHNRPNPTHPHLSPFPTPNSPTPRRTPLLHPHRPPQALHHIIPRQHTDIIIILRPPDAVARSVPAVVGGVYIQELAPVDAGAEEYFHVGGR